MRRVVLGLRSGFAKWKEYNHKIGGLDDPVDVKNKELDKFRTFCNKSHLFQAGAEHPNFNTNPGDDNYIERNEVLLI